MIKPDKQKISNQVATEEGIDINEDLSPLKTLQFDYKFHVKYCEELEKYVECLEKGERQPRFIIVGYNKGRKKKIFYRLSDINNDICPNRTFGTVFDNLEDAEYYKQKAQTSRLCNIKFHNSYYKDIEIEEV